VQSRITPASVLAAFVLASLAVLAAPVVPAAIGQGSGPDAGTFAISPSRRDLVGRPPATLVPTRVSNTTQASYDVRVFPVLLEQDLGGGFRFDETPRPLNAARMILRASPSRFRLRPGQSRQVGLRWERLPIGARAAYIGVVFQGQARLKGGRSVPVITRLLSINFLRLPGRYHPNGNFTALNTIQFAPRVLRIVPRVRNTGDIVGSPRHGRLAIRDSTGRTVYKGRWKGDVVLPRAERDFPIDIHQILPAGRYSARVAMAFGANRHAKIIKSFRLVGPNRLPTPAVNITDFAAHGQVGKPAHLSGSIRSTGTAPASVILSLSLFRAPGGVPDTKPLASAHLRFSRLAPGTRRSLDVDLARRLPEGDYHAVARYTDPTGAPQQLTSDFTATEDRSFFDRIRRFLQRHTTSLIILAIAILVIALLALALLSRQRRLKEELRRAQAELDGEIPPL